MNLQYINLVLASLVVLCAEYCRAEQEYCQRIDIQLCKHLWYNYTQMPNGRGQTSQHDVELELLSVKENLGQCSKYLINFLCVMFLPKCAFSSRMSRERPCKKHCLRIKNDCEKNLAGRMWPNNLSCDDLTDKPVCIGLTAPLPKTSYRHTSGDRSQKSGTDNTQRPTNSAPTWTTLRYNSFLNILLVCCVVIIFYRESL